MQNHKADDSHQDGAGGGNIHRADVEDLSENNQRSDYDKVCQSRGHGAQKHIIHKFTADQIPVWQLGEQESRKADGKHTDQ